MDEHSAASISRRLSEVMKGTLILSIHRYFFQEQRLMLLQELMLKISSSFILNHTIQYKFYVHFFFGNAVPWIRKTNTDFGF